MIFVFTGMGKTGKHGGTSLRNGLQGEVQQNTHAGVEEVVHKKVSETTTHAAQKEFVVHCFLQTAKTEQK